MINIIFFFVLLLIPHQNQYFENLSNSKINWIKIPAGKFIYSFSKDTSLIEYDYYISESEITNNQYLLFLNKALLQRKIKIRGNAVLGFFRGDSIWQKGYYPLLYFNNNDGFADIFGFNGNKFFIINDSLWGEHPVRFVTWIGAYNYTKFYGYRLPNNNEWEKAARGLTDRIYPWGDSLNGHNTNYFKSGDPFDNGTTPIKYFDGKNKNDFQTKNNSSIHGVYDMVGNLSEWTNSYSKFYPKHKIYRGGSWFNKKEDLISYLTGEGGLTLATEYIGFRCVKK